jgi:hypothetical protein
VVIPVVDARADGFGLDKLSAATKRSIEQGQEVFDFAATQESHHVLKSLDTKRSIEHEKASDFATHQQRRGLHTSADELCEDMLEVVLGSTNTGCTCDGGEPSPECEEFLSACFLCDTIQGQRSC